MKSSNSQNHKKRKNLLFQRNHKIRKSDKNSLNSSISKNHKKIVKFTIEQTLVFPFLQHKSFFRITDPDPKASLQNISSTNFAGVEKAWYGDVEFVPFPQTPHPNTRHLILLSKIQKIMNYKFYGVQTKFLYLLFSKPFLDFLNLCQSFQLFYFITQFIL